jgi:hypothetical protein
MTIAAGLLCHEGVLLCADSEHVDWESKSHDSKVRTLTFPGGKLAYAYAGNVPFALTAMQKCDRLFKSKKASAGSFDPVAEVEGILEKEYRRNVLKNPSHSTDNGLDYKYLIAIWTPEKKTRMFVTHLTAMQEVEQFECIGIGEPLARHLIRPMHGRGMPYNHALSLAAYALALVKDSVRDCDGVSVFILLGDDGNVSVTTSEPLVSSNLCAQIELYAKGYDFLTRQLFVMMMDPSRESYFRQNFKITFVDNLMRTFDEICSWRRELEKRIAELNPGFTDSQVRMAVSVWSMGFAPRNQEGRSDPKPPTTDSPPQPPSPEKPGGSGES